MPPQPPPPATTTDTWKPTRDQVRAAAMAFARMDGAEWMRLPSSSREDFLIDGHAALVAAHRVAPMQVPAIMHGTVPIGAAVVCMTKEHADAYAELTKATADIEDRMGLFLCDRRTPWLVRLLTAVDHLRSLTSPESTTP